MYSLTSALGEDGKVRAHSYDGIHQFIKNKFLNYTIYSLALHSVHTIDYRRPNSVQILQIVLFLFHFISCSIHIELLCKKIK